MNAPLIKSLAGTLSDAGFAVLRFNFRGVGRSEGAHGDGVDEIADVAGAISLAAQTHPGMEVGLAGWSFGAVVALRWQAAANSTIRYAGVAPPVRFPDAREGYLPEPPGLAPARRLFIIGDRDQYTTADHLRGYADSIGARLEVLSGSDHFFYFREAVVGRALVEHFK
jgi:alpha/beta superfamily hydrolase